jgi:hypothetical protein
MVGDVDACGIASPVPQLRDPVLATHSNVKANRTRFLHDFISRETCEREAGDARIPSSIHSSLYSPAKLTMSLAIPPSRLLYNATRDARDAWLNILLCAIST